MKIIDLHCDTILGILEQKTSFHITPDKLKMGDYMLQNFALFTDRKQFDPEHQALRLYDQYQQFLEAHKDVVGCVLSYADIEKNLANEKISSLLTLEDGGVVFNDLSMLRNWYRLGVRMIALTWNYENGIGYPNVSLDQTFHDYTIPDSTSRPNITEGLTSFGKDYVREMDRLHMIVDVSHLSDKGFWEVAELVKGPFVASHSNCRSLCDVSRNLSDEMIIELHRHRGVMGINFCKDFLRKDCSISSIEDILAHMKYVKKLVGVDVLALGTDFDGISCNLEIKDASYMPKLVEAMFSSGFTTAEIEKICYKNVLRVYKEVLK